MAQCDRIAVAVAIAIAIVVIIVVTCILQGPHGRPCKLIRAIEFVVFRAVAGATAPLDQLADANFEKGFSALGLLVAQDAVGDLALLVPSAQEIAQGSVGPYPEFRPQADTAFGPVGVMGLPPLIGPIQGMGFFCARVWICGRAFDGPNHGAPVESGGLIVGPFVGLEVSGEVYDGGQIAVVGLECHVGIKGLQGMDLLPSYPLVVN